jgi:H/ACA ribonucleoprotein complex subunit 2
MPSSSSPREATSCLHKGGNINEKYKVVLTFCCSTAAKANVLKRGVKEVVKSLRKSALATPTSRSFDGVVVIAGDISPPDVISHLPVLCEDHGVPYIFIQRRAELGSAARTKRPTSVVMVMEKAESKTKGADGKMVKTKEDVREEDGEGEGDYAEGYTELVGIVQREAREQAHWIKG